MQIPVQISLHGLEHSEVLHNGIREKVSRLDRYYPHLTSCRVVVDFAARHKAHGKPYSVRIDLKVPGGEIAVTHAQDEQLAVALRDAFDAARRKLEDYARTQRGDVKQHAT